MYGGQYSGLVLFSPDTGTGHWALPEDHGTTHICVVDQYGNAASMTSTINTYFGSKVVSPSTGILFNNQMDDFSIPNAANYFGLYPSRSNYVEPLKRPLSSMTPSFMIDKTSGRAVFIGKTIFFAVLKPSCLNFNVIS